MNVANPSESHSSLQSLAPTRSPNQACEISCASRTRMLASPERRDWDRNTRLGLKDKKKRDESHLGVISKVKVLDDIKERGILN